MVKDKQKDRKSRSLYIAIEEQVRVDVWQIT